MRLDLVGCGEAVQRYHAPALALHGRGRVSVRACLDFDRENAQLVAEMTSAAEHGRPRPVRPSDPLDAALVATPPDSHAALVEAYLAAGKHVLVEKPATPHSDDLLRLLELARGQERRLLVNHMKRFFPAVQVARELVRAGFLGRITDVEATEGFRWNWPVSSRYVVESPYGGVLHDTGAHLLDILLFVLSLDEEERASFRAISVRKRPPDEPSHDCRFALALESERHGALAISVALSRLQPLASALKLWGEQGLLIVPTGFAAAPVVRSQGRTFSLVADEREGEATGLRDCFRCSHEELERACRDPAYESVLEGRRFLLLARILEAVWAARSA